MIVEVELGVVDPDRPALAVRDLHHLLSQAGHPVDPPSDVATEFVQSDPPRVVTQRGPLEQRQRADVLWLVGGLDPEECRVGRRQSFVVHQRPLGRLADVITSVVSPRSGD